MRANTVASAAPLIPGTAWQLSKICWRGDLQCPHPTAGRVTDITYVWTLEGWLYLAVILICCRAAWLGWSLSERLERGIALDALKMALQDRQPPQGLLHHSDRGSQYAQPRVSAAAGGTRHPKQHEP